MPAHECIFIGGSKFQTTWPFSAGKVLVKPTVKGRFSVNSQSLMRVLAEQGMGLALLEHSLSRPAVEAGHLVPVLPQWLAPRIPVYAVTTSRLHNATAKAFIQFLAEHLPRPA